MSLGPLTWNDLDAWQRFTGCQLTPLELQFFDIIDMQFLAVQNTAGDAK